MSVAVCTLTVVCLSGEFVQGSGDFSHAGAQHELHSPVKEVKAVTLTKTVPVLYPVEVLKKIPVKVEVPVDKSPVEVPDSTCLEERSLHYKAVCASALHSVQE